MSSQDDPEARIRELERSIGERPSELTQSSSEIGLGRYVDAPPPPYDGPPPPYTAPPPPYDGPPPPYTAQPPPYGVPFPPVPVASSAGVGRGWLVFAVMGGVMVAIVVGVVIFVSNVFSSVDSVIDTFGGRPTASGGGGGPFGVPSGGNHAPAPSADSTVPLAPPGGDISVSGVGENRTIACNDSAISVSGVSNQVVLTGQCRSVTVSGVENTVTVEAVATISASGFDNRVTFLSGNPDIQNSGDSNVVERG
ncbi:MAG: DUF3060 domain-containing protein [Mycobacterium sp.]